MYDFNDADQQRGGELIPDKTIAKLVMSIRPGGAGPGGWLTYSSTSDAEYISGEFTVLEGPFARRKLWQNFVITGGKTNDKGQSIAGEISRATLRAILESSRNINPSDMSPAACEKRRVQSFEEFDGMEFLARIGIQKGKDGYEDKNKISVVITPDKKEYAQYHSGTLPAVGQPATAGTPAWASNQQKQTTPQQQGTATPAWASGPPPASAEPQKKVTIPSWAE